MSYTETDNKAKKPLYVSYTETDNKAMKPLYVLTLIKLAWTSCTRSNETTVRTTVLMKRQFGRLGRIILKTSIC